MKYLIVTGGTLSGCGKGTTISSIGVVLKSMGYNLTAIKIDPYLNVDAGTMSPFEHGEVFVLADGGEGDLDLGNYERCLSLTLTRDHNMTSGKVYQKIIEKERRGEFLGRTVQMVPHVTDCIQEWIERVSTISVDHSGITPDICLIEVGGTVGDIESAVYLEALQQFRTRHPDDDVCLCHLTYLPTIFGELKTKPAQHSVKTLREAGLAPHFVFCRSSVELGKEPRDKLAMFCQVPVSRVISVQDVENTYFVALNLERQQIGQLIEAKLNLRRRSVGAIQPRAISLALWKEFAVRTADKSRPPVKIALVGKYTGFSDSYLSVVRALQHSACEANLSLEIIWVESETLETQGEAVLAKADGILCPGGFGERGISGKALASKFAREKRVPYLGICLGLQTAVLDAAKHLLHIPNADSEEFSPETPQKFVVYMPETANVENMGGTMRLGNRATIIGDPNSLAYKLYDQNPVIYERHRHRYEVNPEKVHLLESVGFKFVGRDEKGRRMEILEIEDHPFFLATQFHPEFTSLPHSPNPCYLGFVLAAAGMLAERLKQGGGKLKPGMTYERFMSTVSTASTASTAPSTATTSSAVDLEDGSFKENKQTVELN